MPSAFIVATVGSMMRSMTCLVSAGVSTGAGL